MDEQVELQEGGADAAALLLQHYDPRSKSWNVSKDSELWDAVTAAHQLQRRGRGTRIAVVDGGFDFSYPALAPFQSPQACRGGGSAAHGTVTALLALEIAPEAELILYDGSAGGRLQMDLVIQSVHEATEAGVDILNLSLGVDYPYDRILRSEAGLDGGHQRDALAPDDWRNLFDIPSSELWEATRAAAVAGITVVAAAGNYQQSVSVPAAVPGVVSVGFQLVERAVQEGMEEAASASPQSFYQSEGTDILIVQPPNILGSSFACPLVSGFAAVMKDRHELPGYIASVRRAAAAGSVMRQIEIGAEPTSESVLLADRLFKAALIAAPHDHYEKRQSTECPDCAVFAAPAYIDFGLFRMNTQDYEVAETVLRAAREFAPRNPYAAANLGVALACLARRSKAAGDMASALGFLRDACHNLSDAVGLRPGYEPYERRLEEFCWAQANLAKWELAP